MRREEVATILRRVWPYLRAVVGVGALIHWVPEGTFLAAARAGVVAVPAGSTQRSRCIRPMRKPATTAMRKARAQVEEQAGMAEHDQKGVAIPRPAAIRFPTPSRRPPSSARVCSRER